MFNMTRAPVLKLQTLTSPAPSHPPVDFDATIQTKQRQRTTQFEYYLAPDGRIWARYFGPGFPRKMSAGNLVDDQMANTWHLFDGNGLPRKGDKLLLRPNEYITQIEVEAEVVVAIANTKRVFMYKHMSRKRSSLTESEIWKDKTGKPIPSSLYLPDNILDWCFSISVGNAYGFRGIKRNFNAIGAGDLVGYYEDGDGVRHDFGNTSTIFVLYPQLIAYTDTGLTGFERGFRTPLDGTIQGQSLGAAGSTLFLCGQDRNGSLRYFTRMVDYEMNGACPGLPYTYTEHNDYSVRPDEIVPLGLGKRKLPSEGWREHILPAHNQMLSCEISIQITGKGNSERQLYVWALHPHYGSVYYTKKIDEANWALHVSKQSVKPGSIYPYNHNLRALIHNYPQVVASTLPANVSVQLLGFHHLLTAEEPCYLALSYGAQVSYIKLHVVDGWGLLQHKHFYPELMATACEPKALKGTFVLSMEQLRDNVTPLGQMITRFFTPYHGQTNRLIIEVEDDTVKIAAADKKFNLLIKRDKDAHEIISSFYIQRALTPVLNTEPQNLEHVDVLITLNQQMLSDIKLIHSEHRHEMIQHSLVSTGIMRAIVQVAGCFLKTFPNRDPRLLVAVNDEKPLLSEQFKTALHAIRQKPEDYNRAVKILEQRIARLKLLRPMLQSCYAVRTLACR